MSDWDRREALALAEALDGHCRDNAVRLHDDYHLALLRAEISKAAQTVSTGEMTVRDFRVRVIDVCQKFNLCKNDNALAELIGCSVKNGQIDN